MTKYISPYNEQALVEQQETSGDYMFRCHLCRKECWCNHDLVFIDDYGICGECQIKHRMQWEGWPYDEY